MSKDSNKLSLPVPVQAPEHTNHLNMLLYGETGVGKTYLIGSSQEVEDMFPMLLIDVEGGTLSIEGRDVDVVRPQSWADMQGIYDFLRNGDHKYKSVAVDSLTEVQQKLSIGTITGEIDDAGGFKNLGRTPQMDPGQWGDTNNQMLKVTRAFRDLAYLPDEDRRLHVILTSLEKEDKKKSIVCPDLSGKAGVGVGGLVDILARLTVVAVEDAETKKVTMERFLLLDRHESETGLVYQAKNRGNRLGRGMWNPTMLELVDRWSGKSKAASVEMPVEPEVKKDEDDDDE